MNDLPMNDDELDPLHELASAYLDGDISPVERARVEASPELVALVEAFQKVRSGLSDVPAASDGTREAALAAALGEFAGMQSQVGSAPVTQGFATSPVVSLAERRRWPVAVLSIAAAVLLVGVIGIAALSGRGSDSKSSSATDAASSQMMPADSAAAESEGADNKAPVSTIGSITGAGAQVSLLIETPEQLLALQAPSDVARNPLPATAPADTSAAGTADTAGSGGTPQLNDTTLAASNYSSSPAISCLTPQQIFLADIQYQGVFGIAARDTVTGVTQAIADDCTVLVSVGP